MAEFSHEKERIPAMSATELLGYTSQLQEELLVAERKAPGTAGMFDEQKKIYEQFIQRLLDSSARFAHIFRTERGSIYFVLETGQSLRIKEQKYGYELQPLSTSIVYTEDGDETRPIDFSLAAQPFEKFQVQRNGELVDMRHNGHKITEIIK